MIVSLCLQDKQGNIPLHLAASFRQSSIANLLLSQPSAATAAPHNHAMLMSANKAGMLPIHAAAIAGCSACCSMCYTAAGRSSAGDMLAAKDKRGLTAAHWATKHGHQASVAATHMCDTRFHSTEQHMSAGLAMPMVKLQAVVFSHHRHTACNVHQSCMHSAVLYSCTFKPQPSAAQACSQLLADFTCCWSRCAKAALIRLQALAKQLADAQVRQQGAVDAEPSGTALLGQSTISGEAHVKPTLIVAPAECYSHRTCPEPITREGPEPPPENVNRLKVLTDPGKAAGYMFYWHLNSHPKTGVLSSNSEKLAKSAHAFVSNALV